MTNLGFDLGQIIRRQFDRENIVYDHEVDTGVLATRYLEMLNRRVFPVPRAVHFSAEIHDSLGALARKADFEHRDEAADAWRTVFVIRHLLTDGSNVNGFLSTRIDHASGRRSRDGLLWDYGMHHFHLSRKPHEDDKRRRAGFVRRSSYLLFSILTQEDAYFVDVRPHPNPQNLGWVRQDVLRIVRSNWPELIHPQILRGVKGDVLTDEEKAELRRKNINHVAELDGAAVAPLGGGTMTDGSSTFCTLWASRLLDEIRLHQEYFDGQPAELRAALGDKGIGRTGELNFDLVLCDGLNLSDELVASLRSDQCLSRHLWPMGFLVVERTTQLLVVVSSRP